MKHYRESVISRNIIEKLYREKINIYRETLSRKINIYRETLSRSFLYQVFATKLKVIEKPQFFFDKTTFRETDDFEKYSSQKDFDK